MSSPEIAAKYDRLVWIDLEMTGLDPERDVIIEMATIVTDSDLNVLAEGQAAVAEAFARVAPAPGGRWAGIADGELIAILERRDGRYKSATGIAIPGPGAR